MKNKLYISLTAILLIMVGCTHKIDIPSSSEAPKISLKADSIALSKGNYTLKAEGLSAYGGAALDKVEFYKGNEKIGEKSIAPYTFTYLVKEATPDQILSFYALLYDKGGNQVKSKEIVAKVKVGPIRIEAENGTLKGVARIADDPETKATSSNQAKVGAIDNPESGVDVEVDILAAGNYLFIVAAGTGFDGTSHKIFIDGKTAEAKIYDIPNRGWNVWQRIPVEFNLTTGKHTVSIRFNTMYGELDYIEYAKK